MTFPKYFSVWWDYCEFDRDPDVAASRLASYVERLSLIDSGYERLHACLVEAIKKGNLQKKLEKDAFVTTLAYKNDPFRSIISYAGSFRYEEDFPDAPGSLDINLSWGPFSRGDTLVKIFWASIDYWRAGEAGLYTVGSEWEFRWRWRRSVLGADLMLQVPLAPGWEAQRQEHGGTLYIYPET